MLRPLRMANSSFEQTLTPERLRHAAGKLIARAPFTDGFEAVPTSAEDIVNTGDGSRFHLADNGLAVVNGPVPLAPRLTDHPLFLAEDGRIDDAAAALEAMPDANQLEGRINFLGRRQTSRASSRTRRTSCRSCARSSGAAT